MTAPARCQHCGSTIGLTVEPALFLRDDEWIEARAWVAVDGAACTGRDRDHEPVAATRSPVGLLEFERAHPGAGGLKADAIRMRLGLRPARYYQLLRAALSTREALEHDALLVHHLTDRYDAASAQRRALTTTRRP